MKCRTCGFDVPDADFFADVGGYYHADADGGLIHRVSRMTTEMLDLHLPPIAAAIREWSAFRGGGVA